MKTFYTSVLLFCLLLGAISFNMLFVRSITSDMLQMLDSLPPYHDAAQAATDLYEYWEAHQVAVSFSANEDAVCELEIRLIELQTAAEQKQASDFATAARLTRAAILRIRNAERFAAENLF